MRALYVKKEYVAPSDSNVLNRIFVMMTLYLEKSLSTRFNEKKIFLFYYKCVNNKHDDNKNIDIGDGKYFTTITIIVDKETTIPKNRINNGKQNSNKIEEKVEHEGQQQEELSRDVIFYITTNIFTTLICIATINILCEVMSSSLSSTLILILYIFIDEIGQIVIQIIIINININCNCNCNIYNIKNKCNHYQN